MKNNKSKIFSDEPDCLVQSAIITPKMDKEASTFIQQQKLKISKKNKRTASAKSLPR